MMASSFITILPSIVVTTLHKLGIKKGYTSKLAENDGILPDHWLGTNKRENTQVFTTFQRNP